MVADKKVKFFLLGSGGGGGPQGGSGEVTSWIIANSAVVPKEEWQDGSDVLSSRPGGPMGGALSGTALRLFRINR